MTVVEEPVSIPPSAFPVDLDPSHPVFGFKCDQWLGPPLPNGPDWFSPEERCRREANMYSYRQKGAKENWCRYLSLGFFLLNDCFECNQILAAMEMDPFQVHISIWYNYRYNVDQEMDIPTQLNAWTMNILREYLAHIDPTTLHGTDTFVYFWKSMPFIITTMDIDDPPTWIPVTGQRR
jgi:hypothetical protein